MDEYYNLLRKFKATNDENFCGAMAYSLITGTHPVISSRKLGRKHGKGTSGLRLNQALRDAGYHLVEVIGVRGYVENLPSKGLTNGTYLVYSASHVSVIKDGVVLDWTAEKTARSKRAKICYQILKTEAAS